MNLLFYLSNEVGVEYNPFYLRNRFQKTYGDFVACFLSYVEFYVEPMAEKS